MIEDTILNDPNSIILTSSLGTLYLLGFIHAEIYKKSCQEIKLYDGINIKNDFLSIADFAYTIIWHVMEITRWRINIQMSNKLINFKECHITDEELYLEGIAKNEEYFPEELV
ncbi:MAG TPA: hypothetical protein LFW14_02725 [Rickettsia endosymbiont of Degeeriella rufa]|nr:hypothetical protein [Rickettsia endosymbiont of Degeeriella rufa]